MTGPAVPAPPKVLVIAGPTASGKKRFALEAAERFGGEIVSADSRKVYRGLDIGTAKPSPADRARIPHHLIDIVDPDEPFSAGAWVELAAAAVRDIAARGRLPIISGGTGFYIRAFSEGLSTGTVADPDVREKLTRDLAVQGGEALHARLRGIDPRRAAELHPNDTVRVMRALEINVVTGGSFGDLAAREVMSGGISDMLAIGIGRERGELYRRIDRRVDAMIDAGLVDEVRKLLSRYRRDVAALDTVGYCEWFAYLDGTASFEECRELVKRNTRRYAKRQLTWFRARPDITWVDFDDEAARAGAFALIAAWLEDGETS